MGYFELRLQIHTLGTSETYLTSCKKEHNRSPLNSKNISKCYCFCCTLDQINAGLVSRRDFECVSRGFLEYEKCDRDRVKYNELRRETWRWFYMDYFNRIFVLDVTYLI